MTDLARITSALATVLALVAVSYAETPPALATGKWGAWRKRTPPPFVRALVVDGGVRVDGKLDEKAWGRTEKGNVIRRLRRDGTRWARRGTECRFLCDTEALYVGVRCSSLRSEEGPPQRKGEAAALLGDRVVLCLDAEADGRSFLMFALNANGAAADLLASAAPDGARSQSFAYSSGWETASRRAPDGWTAEARIPLRAIHVNLKRSGAVVGMDLLRRGARRRDGAWAGAGAPVAPPKFGRLVLGEAPPVARLADVKVDKGEIEAAVDLWNPRAWESVVNPRLIVRRTDREDRLQETVRLQPSERRRVALTGPWSTASRSLVLDASEGRENRPVLRQELKSDGAGLLAWAPECVCRAGRWRLPLRLRVPPGAGLRWLRVEVRRGGDAKAVLASSTQAPKTHEVEGLLDVHRLPPGAYEVRCEILDRGGAAQSRAACAFRVVPRTTLQGTEGAWLPPLAPERRRTP